MTNVPEKRFVAPERPLRHRFGDRRPASGKGRSRKGGCLKSPDLVSQEVTGPKSVPLRHWHQAKSGKRNLTPQILWRWNGLKSRESSGPSLWLQKYFRCKFHHSVTHDWGRFGDKFSRHESRANTATLYGQTKIVPPGPDSRSCLAQKAAAHIFRRIRKVRKCPSLR
jgi:hypothetical protein